MPWEVSGVLEERTRFAVEYESGDWTMTELCHHFGISRKTGYKILERWESAGTAGLSDRNRAPHHHPNRTPAGVVEQVLDLRHAHPRWGPRKLRAWLQRHQPKALWPAASTIGSLLKQAGLASPRRLRRRAPLFTQPFANARQPNDVWCVDFKGWFRTGDGERIDPFTMTDACSRYLLRCQAVDKTDTASVSAICRAAFHEYGLPGAIRSDNGAPFASRAIAGLSRLSVEWMKLGIAPERIQPGHPEQNGRHERMHLTLKQETASPACANRRQQQTAFHRFRRVYNEQRPHEALGMQPPATVYTNSPRRCPERIPQPEYDQGVHVRRVAVHGQFYWKTKEFFLTKVLAGERIGLEQVDDQLYCILFAGFPIAYLNEQDNSVSNLPTPQPSAVESEPNRYAIGSDSTTPNLNHLDSRTIKPIRKVLPMSSV
jgi:putative transposase